jgi:hypothetical protein
MMKSLLNWCLLIQNLEDADIYKALQLVNDNQDEFLEKWREIHGRESLEKEGD